MARASGGGRSMPAGPRPEQPCTLEAHERVHVTLNVRPCLLFDCRLTRQSFTHDSDLLCPLAGLRVYVSMRQQNRASP